MIGGGFRRCPDIAFPTIAASRIAQEDKAHDRRHRGRNQLQPEIRSLASTYQCNGLNDAAEEQLPPEKYRKRDVGRQRVNESENAGENEQNAL